MNEATELLDRVTDRARGVMRLSAAFSKHFAHDDIEPQDLLDALAHHDGISDFALAEAGYARKEAPTGTPDADRMIGASATLKLMVAEALEEAGVLGHRYVGTEHLLLAIARINPESLRDPAEPRLWVLRVLGHSKY